MTKVTPRGYFKYILAADCETSGIASHCDDPSYNPNTKEEYQAVSWGFVIVDADTFKPVEKLYLEVRFDESKHTWDSRTSAIHGFTKEYLKKNGLSHEEAATQIANLIVKYFGPTTPICFMAHNANFDLCFLKRFMRSQGIELNFANRIIDTNGIAYAVFTTFNSDDFFDAAGLPERKQHNALEDVEYIVEAVRRVRLIFSKL